MSTMVQAALVVAVALVSTGAVFRGWGQLTRLRDRRRLPAEVVIASAMNLTIRVFLTNVRATTGFNPRRRNRTKGDLLLTADGMLLTSNRGLLVHLGPQRGRKFSSIRCTGPQRLVFEGDLPAATGPVGLFRYELVIDDAELWATRLQKFVREGADAERYAQRPPS